MNLAMKAINYSNIRAFQIQKSQKASHFFDLQLFQNDFSAAIFNVV